MCCTVNSASSLEISEFVVVADRSTLSQLSLSTTYVYDIKSGSCLVPWTTGKQDLEMFASTCNLPCVKAVWPSFSPEMLHIPPSVVVQLLPAHTKLIRRQMPGQM